jgi:hypothetical protein
LDITPLSAWPLVSSEPVNTSTFACQNANGTAASPSASQSAFAGTPSAFPEAPGRKSFRLSASQPASSSATNSPSGLASGSSPISPAKGISVFREGRASNLPAATSDASSAKA